MGTTARKFYLSTTDHDGTWGTDVRKLLDAASGAANATTKADFGTDTSQRTIIWDPYTTRSTSGTTGVDGYGWAINAAGSDGMEGTASARRFIPSGTWTFNLRLSASTAQTGVGNDRTTITVYVYKVASDGTRTQVWTGSTTYTIDAVTGVSTKPANFSFGGKPEIELAAGETIHVAFTATSVGVSVSGQVLTLHTRGDGLDGENSWVETPSPGVRTRHYETVTISGVGTALRNALAASIPISTTGVGTVAVARQAVASKSIQVTGVGTPSLTRAVALDTITATGVGTVSGSIQVPLAKLPDPEGGGVVRPIVVVDDLPPYP